MKKRSCIFIFLAMFILETYAFTGIRKVYTCEGYSNVLRCGPGETVSIINATYGRIDDNCVPNGYYDYYYEFPNQVCNSSSVTLQVRRYCQCESHCRFTVSNSWLTNPCNAIVYFKKLQINYECIKAIDCLINPDARSRETTITTTTSTTTTNQPTTTTASPITTTIKTSTSQLLTKSPITTTGINNSNKTSILDSNSTTADFPWMPILIALIIFFLILTILLVIYRYKGKYIKQRCFVKNKDDTSPYSETVISSNALRMTPTAPDLNSEIENGEYVYQEISPSQRVMVDNVLYVPSPNESAGKKSSVESPHTARQERNSNEIYESSYSEIPMLGSTSTSQQKNPLSKQTIINELYSSSAIRGVQGDAHDYEDVNNSMVNNVLYKVIK